MVFPDALKNSLIWTGRSDGCWLLASRKCCVDRGWRQQKIGCIHILSLTSHHAIVRFAANLISCRRKFWNIKKYLVSVLWNQNGIRTSIRMWLYFLSTFPNRNKSHSKTTHDWHLSIPSDRFSKIFYFIFALNKSSISRHIALQFQT